MSATLDVPVNFASAVNVRPSQFDWSVISQVSICVIPAMATIDLARPLLGAQYLAASLFLFLGYQVLRRNRHRYMSLLFGAGPAVSLMRGLFFYNSINFFLLLGLGLWAWTALDEVHFVWKDVTWRCLAILATLYWLLTVMLIGNFGANARVMEFAMATAAICLLSTRRAYLATAFIGMAISASAYAIAMLPYGTRLGEGELDNGDTIGNPVLLGVPSALIVLLALSDRGRNLLLESNTVGRMIVGLTAAEWLVLSGSRGSWTITLFCLILVFMFNKQSRKPLLIMVGVACLATVIVLSTDRGDKVSHVFDKTVDSNRSLVNRTSGRSAMWEALPSIFETSPIWGWGPGSGRDVDFLFTNRHLELHSLYLQVIAETGLMGFLPLMIILGSVFRRAVVHLRIYGEVTPLVGIVGFLLIGVSVTAFDIISGTFLGLALMARERNPRLASREIWAITMDETVDEEEMALS